MDNGIGAHAAKEEADTSDRGRRDCGRHDDHGRLRRSDFVSDHYRCRAVAPGRVLDAGARKILDHMETLAHGDRLEILKRVAAELRYSIIRTMVLQYRQQAPIARAAANALLRHATEEAIRECKEKPKD